MATNVFEMFAKLGFDSSSFSSGLSAASGAFSGFSSLIQSGFSALSQTAGAFINDSIQTGMQFDSAMSQVAATMGVTVDEVQELRDFAKEMGSTTAFSASQAAEALNYMALAGYDAEKSMAMLPTVLNLAASGGMQLGRASDMVTDAQSALGLSMEETTQLADKMAAAASKSNTTVSMLGDAILTIGATGREIRGGTTELATILGVLADNGIKAGEGGTHLRNMLLSLQNPTDDGALALEQMGIAIYDSEGKMRSLIDIFADMRVAMDGMDDAAKNTIKNNLFNKTDLASINALLGTSQERFIELGNAIDSSVGSAEKMAGTQLDNLQGDITKFQSALEGIKLSVSEVFTPFKRGMTQFGTDLMGKISTALAIGDTKATTKALLNIGKWTLRDISSTLQEVAPEIIDVITNDVLVPIGESILDKLPDWLGEDIRSIFTTVKDFISGIDTDKIGESLGTFGESLGGLAETLGGQIAYVFENVLSPLGTWLLNDALPPALDILSGAFTALNDVLTILAPIGKAVWEEFLSPFFSILGEVSEGTLKMLSGVFKNIAETFKDFDTIGFIDDIMQGNFAENWKAGIGDIARSILDFGADVDDFFSANGIAEKWNKFWQNAGAFVHDAAEKIVEAFGNIIEVNEKLIKSIAGFPSKWVDFFTGYGEYLATPKGERDVIDSNADGGYVSTPRLSWVAEKEPEYIIPESKMDKVFGRGGNTYNITVNMSGSGNTEEDARNLAELSIQQIRAIGGTGF